MLSLLFDKPKESHYTVEEAAWLAIQWQYQPHSTLTHPTLTQCLCSKNTLDGLNGCLLKVSYYSCWVWVRGVKFETFGRRSPSVQANLGYLTNLLICLNISQFSPPASFSKIEIRTVLKYNSFLLLMLSIQHIKEKAPVLIAEQQCYTDMFLQF